MHVGLTCTTGRGENVKNISRAHEETHELLATASLCMHEKLTERNNRPSISSAPLRSCVAAEHKPCTGDGRWRVLHIQSLRPTAALLSSAVAFFYRCFILIFFSIVYSEALAVKSSPSFELADVWKLATHTHTYARTHRKKKKLLETSLVCIATTFWW